MPNPKSTNFSSAGAKAGSSSPVDARTGAPLKHVVESQQFTVPLLMELFDRSRGMERVVGPWGNARLSKPHHGDVVLCAFDAYAFFF